MKDGNVSCIIICDQVQRASHMRHASLNKEKIGNLDKTGPDWLVTPTLLDWTNVPNPNIVTARTAIG